MKCASKSSNEQLSLRPNRDMRLRQDLPCRRDDHVLTTRHTSRPIRALLPTINHCINIAMLPTTIQTIQTDIIRTLPMHVMHIKLHESTPARVSMQMARLRERASLMRALSTAAFGTVVADQAR